MTIKRKRIEFRWLNAFREEFQTRTQLETFAQRKTGGVWQAKVDDQFQPGILIAYGPSTYDRKKLLELDKRLRRVI